MAKTHYIWDPLSDSYLMETDENGDTTTVYTVEPEPYGRVISQRRGEETSYHHYDALGSTRRRGIRQFGDVIRIAISIRRIRMHELVKAYGSKDFTCRVRILV